MHSDGQTSVLEQPEVALTEDIPQNNPNESVARRVFLAQEHRDLDDMIALLANDNACDEALVARLKKRKLHIKDEIARIEAVAS